MATDPQVFFSRWLKAINDLDWDTLETMIDPEVIGEYPQSGERIHGSAALRQINERYPGGISPDSADAAGARLMPEPERWAISPGYTVVRMSDPDRYTTVVRAAYPDGSHWWLVTLVEIRNERVYRLRSYFAPELAAPLAESIAAWPRG